MLKKGPKRDLLHMDFKERFPYEETPLHYACREGHFEVVNVRGYLCHNTGSLGKAKLASS